METYVTSLADVGRNVKRFMKLFVDTGANKTLVGEEDADTLHDQTPSDSKNPVKQREAIPGAIPHGSHAPEASIELWHNRLG